MSDRAHTRARGLGPAARLVPLLGWLPRYDRAWLTGDVVAGLTVWALAVPESLAYAAIAGVPVQYGLYAMPPALVGYAYRRRRGPPPRRRSPRGG